MVDSLKAFVDFIKTLNFLNYNTEFTGGYITVFFTAVLAGGGQGEVKKKGERDFLVSCTLISNTQMHEGNVHHSDYDDVCESTNC